MKKLYPTGLRRLAEAVLIQAVKDAVDDGRNAHITERERTSAMELITDWASENDAARAALNAIQHDPEELRKKLVMMAV